MYQSDKKLYRSRDRVFFGVCKGFAEWRDLPVFWVRFFTFLAFASTGFFPVGLAYFIAALIIPPEPDWRDYKREQREYERYKRSHFDKERDWDNRFTQRERDNK